MPEKKAIPDLGPLEFRLFGILAKIAPCTARDVLERHNRESGRKLKYTTVMTLLTRMAEKGVLSVDRGRQPFQFSTKVSREQMLRQRVQDFVNLFFEGRAVDLAVRLVEEAPLSAEAIERLEASLDRQRAAAPEDAAKEDGER